MINYTTKNSEHKRAGRFIFNKVHNFQPHQILLSFTSTHFAIASQ